MTSPSQYHNDDESRQILSHTNLELAPRANAISTTAEYNSTVKNLDSAAVGGGTVAQPASAQEVTFSNDGPVLPTPGPDCRSEEGSRERRYIKNAREANKTAHHLGRVRKVLLMLWCVAIYPMSVRGEERWGTVANRRTSVLIGFFFSLLDTTIVATSLVHCANDLKGFSNLSWVIIAYLLTYMGQ